MKHTFSKKRKIYESITYLVSINKKISKITLKYVSSVITFKNYGNIRIYY